MSLPRRNVLANVTRIGYDLVSIPYDLTPLQSSTTPLVNRSDLANSSFTLDYGTSVPSGALYFTLTIFNIPPNAIAMGTANFTFSSSATGENINGGFFLGGDTPFFINRGGILGFDNPFFTDKFSTNTIIDATGTWVLRAVIDRSVLEVFLDEGQKSATTTFFAEGLLDTLVVGTAGINEGVVAECVVYGLDSAWEAEESASGLVLGNVTSSANSTNATMGMYRV